MLSLLICLNYTSIFYLLFVQIDKTYQATSRGKWGEALYQSSADTQRNDDQRQRIWREGIYHKTINEMTNCFSCAYKKNKELCFHNVEYRCDSVVRGWWYCPLHILSSFVVSACLTLITNASCVRTPLFKFELITFPLLCLSVNIHVTNS